MLRRSGAGRSFSFRRLRAVTRPDAVLPPLVLIHGMSAGPDTWDPVLPLLAETRTVHVVTLPGHRGGVPIAHPEEFTSTLYVDVVEAELDRLGIDRADLVGNSLGGWVALQLAGRGRASSVVCLSPAGGWPVGGPFDRFLAAQFSLAYRTVRRLSAQRDGRLLFRRTVRRAFLVPMVARPENVTDAAYRAIVANIAACDALRLSIGRPSARDVHDAPPVDCPVLLAWGGQDRILVSRASRRRLALQVGDPEVVVLPHVGHVPMSDAPELVASTILEFTQGASLQPPSFGGIA